MMLVVADDKLDSIVVEAWGRRYQIKRDALAPAADGSTALVAERARRAETVIGLITDCAHEVAARSGVPLTRMRGPWRSEDIAAARMAAMWLAHARHGIHEAELGLFFHRHRTTVIHALQTVYRAIRENVAAARWLPLLPDADVARAREEIDPSMNCRADPARRRS